MYSLLLHLFMSLLGVEARPQRVTRPQMAEVLQRVVEGRMPGEDWHTFIHRKIMGDAYLERLRQRLVELPLKTRREHESDLYRAAELQEIAGMLAELWKKIEPSTRDRRAGVAERM